LGGTGFFAFSHQVSTAMYEDTRKCVRSSGERADRAPPLEKLDLDLLADNAG
jgi:hypothetical protein